jgi:hypothetical protein
MLEQISSVASTLTLSLHLGFRRGEDLAGMHMAGAVARQRVPHLTVLEAPWGGEVAGRLSRFYTASAFGRAGEAPVSRSDPAASDCRLTARPWLTLSNALLCGPCRQWRQRSADAPAIYTLRIG